MRVEEVELSFRFEDFNYLGLWRCCLGRVYDYDIGMKGDAHDIRRLRSPFFIFSPIAFIGLYRLSKGGRKESFFWIFPYILFKKGRVWKRRYLLLSSMAMGIDGSVWQERNYFPPSSQSARGVEPKAAWAGLRFEEINNAYIQI